MWFILFLISAIGLIISILINLKLLKKKKYFESGKDKYKSEKLDLENQLNKARIKIQELKIRNTELEENNKISLEEKNKSKSITESIKNKYPNQKESLAEQANVINEVLWTGAQLKSPKPYDKKEIFFKGPIGDNQFLKNDASEEQKATFVYKIEVNQNGNGGKLFLDPKHASDLDLIRNFPESILENACIYENAFKVDFKNLRQTSPGTVVNDGAHWKVTEKVKVRFD